MSTPNVIDLKGKDAPSSSLNGNVLRVEYASLDAYAPRCSADNAVIRKAAKVVSAEIPPHLPSAPVVVLYTIAG